MVLSNNSKRKEQSVLIKVFNNGYIISILLYLASSIGTLCDGVVASRGLGVAELVAIGLTYPYSKIIEGIYLVFSSGSQVVIGRKIGQNKFEEVSKVFYTSIMGLLVISLFIVSIIVIFLAPFSRFLGASSVDKTLTPTMDYLISLVLGLPAYLLSMYMIPLFQLDEKKKLVTFATITMTVVNVSLNILFILNNFGIKGIGYSTSISYWLGLLILSTHFFEKKKGIILQGKVMINVTYLKEIFKEGVASVFKCVTSVILNISVNNILAFYCSPQALAAFSLFKMTKFIFVSVSEGLINPTRMIQSMLYEEKNVKIQKKIFKYAMSKSMILATILSAVLCIFARNMYSIFASGDVLEETVILMRWASIIFFLNALKAYYQSYYLALNKKKIVYLIMIVLNIFPIPIFYILVKKNWFSRCGDRFFYSNNSS